MVRGVLLFGLFVTVQALVFQDYQVSVADAKQRSEITSLRDKQQLVAKELAEVEERLSVATWQATQTPYSKEIDRKLAELEDRKERLARKQEAIRKKAGALQKKLELQQMQKEGKQLADPPAADWHLQSPQERAKAAAEKAGVVLKARVDAKGRITREERVAERKQRFEEYKKNEDVDVEAIEAQSKIFADDKRTTAGVEAASHEEAMAALAAKSLAKKAAKVKAKKEESTAKKEAKKGGGSWDGLPSYQAAHHLDLEKVVAESGIQNVAKAHQDMVRSAGKLGEMAKAEMKKQQNNANYAAQWGLSTAKAGTELLKKKWKGDM